MKRSQQAIRRGIGIWIACCLMAAGGLFEGVKVPSLMPVEAASAAGTPIDGRIHWVGDSRTVQLGDYINAAGSGTLPASYRGKDLVYALTSIGYDWMVSQIGSITRNLQAGDTIVVCMGINDMMDVGPAPYADLINALAAGEWAAAHVAFVSLNPVDDAKIARILTRVPTWGIGFNADIECFNQVMQERLDSSVTYVDTYSWMRPKVGELTQWDPTGAHYNEAGYAYIYQTVRAAGGPVARYTGWKQSGSTWYYLENGTLWIPEVQDGEGSEAALKDIEGQTYAFRRDGSLIEGQLFLYRKSLLYANAQGVVTALEGPAWIQCRDGRWYWIDAQGQAAGSWNGPVLLEIGGKTYGFSQIRILSSGSVRLPAMLQGWQELPDEEGQTAWYFFASNGAMVRSQWILDQNHWYYLLQDGTMARSQWIQEYYVGRTGAMLRGQWIHTPEGWAYVRDDGTRARSVFIDGYWIGTDGIWKTAAPQESV